MRQENFQPANQLVSRYADLAQIRKDAQYHGLCVLVNGRNISHLMDANVTAMIVARIDARLCQIKRELRALGVEI